MPADGNRFNGLGVSNTLNYTNEENKFCKLVMNCGNDELMRL